MVVFATAEDDVDWVTLVGCPVLNMTCLHVLYIMYAQDVLFNSITAQTAATRLLMFFAVLACSCAGV
jgi:hypothetical protein